MFDIDGEIYVFHTGHHYMGKLSSMNIKIKEDYKKSSSLSSGLSNNFYLADKLIRPNHVVNNPAENKLNKKYKKRRKR